MAALGASTVSLQAALQCIRLIETRIASTNGQLTKQIFSNSHIGNPALETARESIGLNFQSVVQNIRALKQTDPILTQHPKIHWNLPHSVARRNWLAHEYGTVAPIKWNEVADSVYDDLPVMKTSIIAALQALGIANP